MVEETLVFVDEGFLSRLSKYFGKGKYIKFDKINFVKNIIKKENLSVKHIFYATAPPFQSGNPSEDEKKRKEGYDKFKSKLSGQKEFSFLEGRCQRVKNKEGKFVYHQKGVDTVLTMALSSFKIDFPNINKIVLVACDSDFVPVIDMLKGRGVEVLLFSYYERVRDTEFSRSHHLIDACSKCIQLTKKDFEGVHL